MVALSSGYFISVIAVEHLKRNIDSYCLPLFRRGPAQTEAGICKRCKTLGVTAAIHTAKYLETIPNDMPGS